MAGNWVQVARCGVTEETRMHTPPNFRPAKALGEDFLVHGLIAFRSRV